TAAGDGEARTTVRAQRFGSSDQFVPGLRRIFRIEAGFGEVALVVDHRQALDAIGYPPELTVLGHVIEGRRNIVLAILQHIIERDDEIVFRITVHPAVLDVDDVGRSAGLQGGQYALRQTVGRGDL